MDFGKIASNQWLTEVSSGDKKEQPVVKKESPLEDSSDIAETPTPSTKRHSGGIEPDQRVATLEEYKILSCPARHICLEITRGKDCQARCEAMIILYLDRLTEFLLKKLGIKP